MYPLEQQPKYKDIVVIDDIVFISLCKCNSSNQHKEMLPHYRVTCAIGLTWKKMKSPLFGSQEEHPSPKRQGHSCFLYYLLIFFCYLFVFIRAKRSTTYFSANCLPSAFSVRRLIVGRLVLASTQHPTSAEDHRLQLGPSAEAMYLFGCLSELIYFSNFAFI